DPCVGHDPKNDKHYKVFKYKNELKSAGYVFDSSGTPFVYGSWDDYVRFHHLAELPEEKWYEELDRLDDAARKRRQGNGTVSAPLGKGRDDVAAWVAKNHFLVDSSIRQVLYLPKGAAADEIRLLEVSDRLSGPEGKLEALDFGLDVDGEPFHLLVADVTTDQLDQIKRDQSGLPRGWLLEGHKVWRRGA
ncbi:MAG TPA: hypothetical protein VE988_01305, partial [Gemmataceae bacterium]|nr:hypothetical protein [Gemmataceae bacterium]